MDKEVGKEKKKDKDKLEGEEVAVVSIDRVAENIKITLEALRKTIRNTLPRINMTQSIGLNPVESDILEKSDYGLSVVDMTNFRHFIN